MFEEFKICPYTGLRPFTEDESIYFKGRDEHIEQATKQLEKNKFIMLTGASGDGKSSLVYAGIIPNAKAGFLKASFSNWSIVDFRPERTPLTNLSKALAQQLGIGAETVQTELNYGFSALVDVYKASQLYNDTASAEWLQSDEKTKNEKRRKASNLIILADQFEEFFTNPENFQKGIPSQEAMSVTNLLLETARIALEENLPIYVIITMRSDFIGQCAAFRGLPEYIGFSQFFVPRLNRKELREVIEDPALLSGNKISRRLTERLIHDIVEGTDQLPILQHALNQIWKMADEGQSEMDLIQYAMVGGMEGTELPPDDATRFRTWFESLPKKVQECYDRPSLQNVLNTHANKLYNQASDYLKENKKESVSDEQAKKIIETSFKCLTKIDNSRAVRNRMTLGEITAVINEPHLDYKKVGSVLNVFRQPGNTLLRPFSEETPELAEGDVLDITHESLIRNWENLEQWAKEEFNSYTISLDFGQQLNRWIESKKSDDFLLYIGPLTYFEGWINKVKPNAAWVARYLKDDLDQKEKLAKAEGIQQNATQFLKRSARKHTITRTIIKYGPRRIAAVLGAIALLTLSSFMVRNYWQRQNSYVLKDIKEKTLALAANSDLRLRGRIFLVCEQLRLGEVSIPEVVSSIKDPIEKINVTVGIATFLAYEGRNDLKAEISQSLVIADSLVNAYPVSDPNPENISNVLKEINDLRETLELSYFYIPSEEIKALRKKNAERSAAWVLWILRNRPNGYTDVNNLNIALEHALNYRILSAVEIDELIKILSPLEGGERSQWVKDNYKPNDISNKGFFGYGFKFNGLYQELAYLYAASGNVPKALQAIDTLLVHTQSYPQNNYADLADNASHIAASFYRYGKTQHLDEFVQGYCKRKKITEEEFYARLLGRCKTYEFATVVLDWDPRYDLDLNLSLEYSDDAQLDFFFNKYREVVNRTISDPNARNFQLALSYKDQGILHLRKVEVAGLDSLGKQQYLALFHKAVSLYRSIDQKFLDQDMQMVEISSNDNMTMARKFLFIYPDIRTPFHPNEPRLFHYFFVSGCFLDFILDHKLFDEFYPSGKELKYFEIFLRDYHFTETEVVYTASKRMSYGLLAELEKRFSQAKEAQFANIDFLYLYLGHLAAQRHEPLRSAYYYKQLTAEKLKALFLNSFNPDFAYRQVALAVSDLSRENHPEEANRIINFFDGEINRSSLNAYAAKDLLQQGIRDARVDRLIDSARAQIARSVKVEDQEANRALFAEALTMRNNDGDLAEAYKVIKNVNLKFIGMAWIARSLAYQGKLFEATKNEPANISDVDIAIFNWYIVVGYGDKLKLDESKPRWNEYTLNRLWEWSTPINYNENN